MKRPEVTFARFKGVRNTLAANALEPDDLVAAVNVDLDDAGGVSRRPGVTAAVAGAAHSLWAPPDGSEPCVFVQSGTLKRLTALDAATTLGSGYSDLPMAYVKVNDRVYFANGVESGVIDNGAVRAWGLDIPAFHVTRTLGELGSGTYQCAITTIAADGRESGADMAVRMDVADGSGLAFTWDAVDGAQVALYVSERNGETLYRAGVVDAALGTFTWAGGALAVSLGTQFLDKPPVGTVLGQHNGRVYIGAGSFIFPTVALAYEHCDLRDYLAIDGTPVTMIEGVDAGLFVGTQQAGYFLPGGRIEDMGLRKVVDAAVVPGSAVVEDATRIFGKGSGRTVLFASALGIHAGLPDGSIDNLSRERFVFDVPARAAATLRADTEITQYVLNA